MGFSFKAPFLPDSSGVHGQIHLHHGVYTAVLKGTHSCPLWLNEWWSKNESPGGSGPRRGLAGFQMRKSHPFFFLSLWSGATAGTCFHLRAFSAECGRPQSRKRGRRQRRRRHPGAGAGEAGTIAATISFPAAGAAAARSDQPCLRVALPGL